MKRPARMPDMEARIDRTNARAASKAARRARDAENEAWAQGLIRTALRGCPEPLQAERALALVEASTVAAGDHHDEPTIQAVLGKLAHDRGAKIQPPKASRQAAAERLFKEAAE